MAIQTVKSVCPLNCPDTCGIVTTVEDGRVIRTTGDPDHPITRGWLCRKGSRYLERHTSPDRLLYPQRRIGPKGEGRFDRISWDDALAGDRRRVGPGGDPAVRLLWHHGGGAADRRRAPFPQP